MGESAALEKLKVLIADDSRAMRAILRGQLVTFGISQISEADSGKTALSLLKKHEIDLIFCDWNMPEPNGLEVLVEVRKNEKYKSIPFIMVTTEGDKEHLVSAAEAGVTDYIVKPFSPELLLQKINRILI